MQSEIHSIDFIKMYIVFFVSCTFTLSVPLVLGKIKQYVRLSLDPTHQGKFYQC